MLDFVVRGGSASNLVTVALGPQGQVRMRNAAGQVHLIADLAGYANPENTVVRLSDGTPIAEAGALGAGTAAHMHRCACMHNLLSRQDQNNSLGKTKTTAVHGKTNSTVVQGICAPIKCQQWPMHNDTNSP